MRIVVVGASSGLGRCIGVGLGQRGDQVALLARRGDHIRAAASEAGHGAIAIECDATDSDSARAAMSKATESLGGIDAMVYTPAISPLVRLADTDADTWRRVFDTNVTGAALMTAAALPHLQAAPAGRALYLSSVSASLTPPWPGLGAYGVSKAALDRLVEAWRAEHPEIAFTRVVVGECAGGEGDAQSGLAAGWDLELAAHAFPDWINDGYMSGALIDIEHLIDAVGSVLHSGTSLRIPSIFVTANPIADEPLPPISH